MSDLQPAGCEVCHDDNFRDDENGVSECQTCASAVRLHLRPLFTKDNMLTITSGNKEWLMQSRTATNTCAIVVEAIYVLDSVPG